MINARRFAIWALILFSYPSTLLALKVGDSTSDRYWQITQEVLPEAKKEIAEGKIGNVPQSVFFWRTHTNGKTIEIYDACDEDGKANATASQLDAYSWKIKGANAKNLTAKIDKKTQVLSITLDPGNTLWASGQRILKPECAKGTIPKSVTQYWAKEGELSFAACGKDEISAPGYKCYDKFSGMGHLLSTVGKSLQSYRNVATPKVGAPTAKKVDAGTKVCTQAAVTEESVHALADSPALSRIPEIYPGALLQGTHFQKEPTAVLAPITIDRAGGKITMNGIAFGKSEDGDFPRVFTKVEAADQGDVMQAITNLLGQEIKGTQASASFTTVQVKSLDHMAFQMGVDGRYAGVEFSAAFKADMKSEKNYVLARFTQLYYDVSFQLPSNMEDVFDAGDRFKDRQNQIGFIDKDEQGNPLGNEPGGVPLIISNVSYGRTIYFLASSTSSATDISAALSGAYGNKDGGQYIEGSASMTYEKMMASTEITYFVLGGEAVETLGPIGQATSSADMFKKIKEVISSERVAQVTDKNQGMAVAYTAKYLTSNATAQMGYATSFVNTECTIVSDGFHSFSLDVTGIDDKVKVTAWPEASATSQTGTGITKDNPKIVYNGINSMYGLKLDSFIPAKDEAWVVRVELYNIAGPSGINIRFWQTAPVDPNDLIKDPIPPPKKWTPAALTESGEPGPAQHRKCIAWNVGWCVDYTVRLNRKTGEFNVINDTNS